MKTKRTQTTPFRFKRWSNKSYAVFNSLNRCVVIGVLSFSYSMLVSPERCSAQTDTARLKQIDLEELEVSAEASPNVYAPIGRTITQVQKNEIERAAVQNLIDMLEFIPNVDLRQRGPFGAQADVSIRGSSFDQTLVLLNGINISDPQTGHYSLNLPLDLESVEKIEVLEGPAARIFGNNALGGAVNFITGTHRENYLKASLAGGQHGFYKATLTGTTHTKQTTHHLSLSQTASDGYMENTDFQNFTVFSQNKWANKIVPLDLQLGFSQKDFGANSFYGPQYPEQYESLHTFFAALKGDAAVGRVSISPAVYWRRNYDEYILIRSNPDVYHNFHYTDVYGLDVTASQVNRLGRATAGVLVRDERIFSNNIGDSLESPRRVPWQDNKWYHLTSHRTNLSAFAEQNIYLGNWSASVGMLLNHNNYTGKKLNVYPGIDLAYRPLEQLKLYASANSAMRLPTFTDLYYTSPIHLGDRDLKPERSAEYELGANFAPDHWSATVCYFFRNITDAIDWIRLPGDARWQSQNLTNIRTHGISASGQWNLKSRFGEGFAVQMLSAGYTFMDSQKTSLEYESSYVLDQLRHKLNLGLTHRIIEKICANWSLGWQERNGSYSKYDRETGEGTPTPYPSFWQIDLRIYRQTKRFNVFVEASNLADKQYQDFGNILLPGRWVRVGGTVTLGT